jgi:hypothetical protein
MINVFIFCFYQTQQHEEPRLSELVCHSLNFQEKKIKPAAKDIFVKNIF